MKKLIEKVKIFYKTVKLSEDIMKNCVGLHVMIRGIIAEGLWNDSIRGVE